MNLDASTRDALALLATYNTEDTETLARTIVQMDTDELRRLITRLFALIDIRHTVGTDIEDTQVWARWLLIQDQKV